MAKKILVIAAHPDDELLGTGGTLKRLIEHGYEVVSVICAQGRREEAHHIKDFSKKANKHLGIKEVLFLDYPNLEMETIPLHQINKELENLIQIYHPETIFTHHYGDLNRDHQIVFQSVMTAARPVPGSNPIDLICFETVSSSEWSHSSDDKTFKPNYFVDVTGTMEDKIAALKHYEVEMRPFPHPRSYEGVRSLGKVRGMTIGRPYAEAFEVIRRVWG